MELHRARHTLAFSPISHARMVWFFQLRQVRARKRLLLQTHLPCCMVRCQKKTLAVSAVGTKHSQRHQCHNPCVPLAIDVASRPNDLGKRFAKSSIPTRLMHEGTHDTGHRVFCRQGIGEEVYTHMCVCIETSDTL